MANIKVSEMTQANSVNDQDLLMIVQGSTNKKVTKQTLMEDVETELSGKVDKVEGKGLSTNDFTDAEKTKLDGIDLTDYVKNTDYARNNKGGVVKVQATVYGLGIDGNGFLSPQPVDYNAYLSKTNFYNIDKGTLENVITGKNLETANNKVTSISSSSTDTQYPSAKCVYDLVGDIESILEELDIGGGVE